MNLQTQRFTIAGPAGALEVLRDEPALSATQVAQGVAVIAHPHPLFGGTMDNKVVQTLARAFVQSGWQAVRFNFRGVGASQGTYDQGHGELQDMQAVIAHCAPSGPIALAGFSFGAFVAACAAQHMHPARSPQQVVLVGTAASRFEVPPIAPELHARTLVVHGEADEVVPLADVLQWARPQVLPVTVVPAGGHFFHGQLPLLRQLVTRHLGAAIPSYS